MSCHKIGLYEIGETINDTDFTGVMRAQVNAVQLDLSNADRVMLMVRRGKKGKFVRLIGFCEGEYDYSRVAAIRTCTLDGKPFEGYVAFGPVDCVAKVLSYYA